MSSIENIFNMFKGKSEYSIDKCYYNKKTRQFVVHWEDGDVTYATCAKDDDYDPVVGLSVATAKKVFGSKSQINNVLKETFKEDKKKGEK